MATISGTGNTWNLPNYAGELFTAQPEQTPLLSMIGGLTGGKTTDNYEFPTAVVYEQEEASQPDISETLSTQAGTPKVIDRAQEKNVVQIHKEDVELSYVKLSNMGRLSGLNTAGANANPPDEWDFQVAQKLKKIARDVEYSFIMGSYRLATAANVANRTRGMLELCDTLNNIDASGAPLSTALLKAIAKELADNGALFGNMVLHAGSTQRQRLTDLYESQLGYNAPARRDIGGMSIKTIETDFFSMGVVYNPHVPADTILIADVAYMAPVFQVVPGKGVLFEEPKEAPAASKKAMLFGQIGLAHGPAFLHASITGLDA